MAGRAVGIILVASFVATTLIPCHSFAQDPIKIGFVYCFSGRLGHYGYGAKQGAEMAMREINQKGGVNGRKLVGIYEDTELKPDIGAKAARKLVTEDGVDVVMGIVSSGVARATAPIMNELRTPLIITLAMTPDVTGAMCNPYTFRVSLNGPQNLRGAAFLASEIGARKWTTMGPDYIFGYQCWEYFQKYLRPLQPNVTFAPNQEIAFAPVTTTNFRPYIDKVMRTGADGVLISLYGGNLIDFVRQAIHKGFFKGNRKVMMNLAYSADVLYGLGLEMPKDLWLGGLYWFQGNQSPMNERFVASYASKFKIWPDYNAHGAYAGVHAYVAAIKAAGSTDKARVAKALEGLELELPVGNVQIRAEDHQAVVMGVWGQTSDYVPKWRCRILTNLKYFPGDEITRPISETGCRHKPAKPVESKP